MMPEEQIPAESQSVVEKESVKEDITEKIESCSLYY